MGDVFCSHCGTKFTQDMCNAMKQRLKQTFWKELVEFLIPVYLFGMIFTLLEKRTPEWFDVEPKEEPHPHVYTCPACKTKVAWGDNYCRKCGIEFTRALCEEMKDSMKMLSKENLPSLVFLALAITGLLVLTAMMAG